MSKYVAIVFDDDQKAYDGLHALWNLDTRGDITVYGAAVVHRDKFGNIDVATKNTDTGLNTAIGLGVGLLLGALAGPIGAAAGASIAAGTALGIGGLVGGFTGLSFDIVKADENEQAQWETGFVLPRQKSAVIAEVSEPQPAPIDEMVKRLGGTIFRRDKKAIRSDVWFETGLTSSLYPYDYEPRFEQ